MAHSYSSAACLDCGDEQGCRFNPANMTTAKPTESETPLTDAENRKKLTGIYGREFQQYKRMLDFARDLEKKLNAANAEVERLNRLIGEFYELSRPSLHSSPIHAIKLSIKNGKHYYALLENSKRLGNAFHNYPNVPSHQRCLDALAANSKLMERFPDTKPSS